MRTRDTPWGAQHAGRPRFRTYVIFGGITSSFTIPSQNLSPLTLIVHRISVGNPPKPDPRAMAAQYEDHARPPWPQPAESNKGVPEGLSAWEGESIRVRRESPSKGPKNGAQMVPSPIALVGAIGEACGEAPRVSLSGTPPLLCGGTPRGIENRYRFVGIKKAPRAGCCGVWWASGALRRLGRARLPRPELWRFL